MAQTQELNIEAMADEIYNELAFEHFIQNHDLDHLSDEEQNEFIELYNKKKNANGTS